ncbi:MAG: TRAP transporter small permease subunit [Alphaproteobacteria bacterium]|nr:TRAP transporter small permease subunit [Alphaproteobacteria bacterium]
MAQFLVRLGNAHDHVTKTGFALSQIALLAIVLSYSYEIVARYFFASPTSWSNEVVAYALCIGTFLAFPEITRTSGHIAISFLTEPLTPTNQKRVAAIVNFFSFLVCILVAWICLTNNISQFLREEMLVRVNPIPKYFISVFLTYGFANSTLYFLRYTFAPPDNLTDENL